MFHVVVHRKTVKAKSCTMFDNRKSDEPDSVYKYDPCQWCLRSQASGRDLVNIPTCFCSRLFSSYCTEDVSLNVLVIKRRNDKEMWQLFFVIESYVTQIAQLLGSTF